MSISRQIGWSNESNLLYQILKQLTKLTSVIFNLTPKYKVYTALLTQSGGDNVASVSGEGGTVNIGTTYLINENPDNYDLTIYGAPNNNVGTYFVSNQTSILNYTDSLQLAYNEGAPVVTVLENTIGNIWFIYRGDGSYGIKNSEFLFSDSKTVAFNSVSSDPGNPTFVNIQVGDENELALTNFYDAGPINGIGLISIEIRVYN